MTLRKKTLIIIGITLVGLVALLYFISQTILLNSFAQLEDQVMRQNVERVSAALQDQLAALDSINGDWAPWDDTYTFVQDHNEAFIENNLSTSTLVNLNLNFMLFFDTSNQLVVGRAVDLESGVDQDVPASLLDYVAANKLILSHDVPDTSLTGVLPLPEAPLLFASQPILTNNHEGPIQGSLIVGRYLDTAEIERLAEATRLNLSVRRFDEAQLPPDFQTASTTLSKEAPIFVQPLSQQQVAGYTLVEDIYGQPTLLLKIEQPRMIYQQGQASLRYFIVAILLSGLVFGLVIWLLLEKGVLSHLTRLTQSVSSIAASGNSAERIQVSGDNELANLAKNINHMLVAWGQSEEALRKAHHQLEDRVEARTIELSQANRLLQQEIQERRQVEEALRESEQRFRQLVSSISDHIYVSEITPEGQPNNLYLSHHVETLTGYPFERFANDWSFWPNTVIHPEDRSVAAEQAARLSTGKNSQLEYRLVRADGEIIWVRDSAQVQRDTTRQSTFVYGVVSDVTERKRIDEALWQSEQRTRLIIDMALDAVIAMDATGLITDWNTQAEAIFGWSHQEAVGRFLADTIIPAHYREAHQRGLKHFLATGEGSVLNQRIELTALHREGHEFPVELAVSVLRSQETVIFSAFVRDITDRKQAEADLRDSETKYKAIATTMPGAIYQFTSRNGVWIVDYMAPQTLELFGVSDEEFMADINNFIQHIHPDDLPQFVTSVTEAVEKMTPWDYEGRLTNPSTGELVWWQGMSTPIANASGEVIFNGILLNITERKRAEAELAQAHNEALEVSRLKSELLANVSHDLRTPLTAILGYTDMLQVGVYGDLSDKQQSVAMRIMINTKQLLLFINNILDQAQIEAGKLELRISPLVPANLIEVIQSTMAVLAQAKGLELSSDIAPDLPPTLPGDFQRLQSVLMNLISNAIKFTKQGTVHVRFYRPDAAHWAVQVSDTGCGIPVAAQAYIFDPFRRVDGTITREQVGSGLGLSIVKRLTTLMGGEISLTSEPEQGSTFTIVLPLMLIEEAIS